MNNQLPAMAGFLGALRSPNGSAGKPSWQPVLSYVRELRARSIFPDELPMPCDWLDIGPGYVAGPACGHFDVHFRDHGSGIQRREEYA